MDPLSDWCIFNISVSHFVLLVVHSFLFPWLARWPTDIYVQRLINCGRTCFHLGFFFLPHLKCSHIFLFAGPLISEDEPFYLGAEVQSVVLFVIFRVILFICRLGISRHLANIRPLDPIHTQMQLHISIYRISQCKIQTVRNHTLQAELNLQLLVRVSTNESPSWIMAFSCTKYAMIL